jgi:phosphoesterase RecJ-like protein
MWSTIKQLIREHQHFLVTTHVNPDGDGIGASTALIELLRLMGKTVSLACDSPISPRYQFLNYHNLFELYNPLNTYDQIEVVIVLDTHRKERVGRITEIIDRPTISTICIDHHEITELFTPHTAIDPHASSVGAMIYTLFKELGYPLNKEAAMGIYTSIVTDTGRFCYDSTSRKTHKIADECMGAGVNPAWMHRQIFQNVPIEHIAIFNRALASMESYFNGKVIIQTLYGHDLEAIGLPAEDLAHFDLEFLIDFNRTIQGVETLILIREPKKGSLRISIRSNEIIDCGKIMKEFDGGGHARAAGASVESDMILVKENLLLLIELELMKAQAIEILPTCQDIGNRG